MMGRALSCSVILRLKFFAVFDISFNKFPLSVCEYVDAEFLFLFGETSANSLKIKYFLHINAMIPYQ